MPIAGFPVRLALIARRFYCDAVLCGRRIFAERFDPGILAPWARRTARLDHIVYHLGLALGGRPAATFAHRLMLPVSNDTLLRAVRRRGNARIIPPTVVGIDEWAARRRRADKAEGALSRAPSARTIARLMTVGRDRLAKSETVTVAAIERAVPRLVEAREIIAAFQAMVRKKSLTALAPWLERARASLVASFAKGVVKDQAAVSAAITSSWSNGQTEGQVTKLKLVKRQMYGRGKLDLLQARVIGVT